LGAQSCAAGKDGRPTGVATRGAAIRTQAATQSDAAPGRSRNLSRSAEGRSVRVARPHTSVASLFAARFRVCLQLTLPRGQMQPLRALLPAPCEKNVGLVLEHRLYGSQ